MFEQTFVQAQAKTRKPWTVLASLSLQCGAVAIVLVIPLLHPERLRMPELPKLKPIATWVNLAPVPIQRSQVNSTAIPSPRPSRALVWVPQNSHPVQGPSINAPTLDADFDAWAGPIGVGFGPPSLAQATLPPRVTPPQPTPAAQPKPAASGPVKIGGTVQSARLTFSPRPIYPQMAIATRTQGTVKLEAIIAADGTIRNLRTLSGSPLLIEAALNAVKQWRYQPTLLNGVPVEVLTEIEVNFSLNR